MAVFPEIGEKRHNRVTVLSVGRQQMLAVAQVLVRRTKLLRLDEWFAALSPVLVDRVLAVTAKPREDGISVLLVDQLIEKALALADRIYAIARSPIMLKGLKRTLICRDAWTTAISARKLGRPWPGKASVRPKLRYGANFLQASGPVR